MRASRDRLNRDDHLSTRMAAHDVRNRFGGLIARMCVVDHRCHLPSSTANTWFQSG
jgi:hypothetical protein